MNLEDIHFILDCDGVLLDWSGGFAEYLTIRKGLPVDPKGPCDYDMVNWTGAKDRAQVLDWVREFNASPDFSALESMRWAKTAVKTMAAAGARISVLTSCGESELLKARRKLNLLNVFGDVFSDVRCLPLTRSKVPELAEFSSTRMPKFSRTIWVEDNYTHAFDGHSLGHETYMVRHRHNRLLEKDAHFKIQWCNNLWEVFERATSSISGVAHD